jgi:hypothetical protein
MDNKTLSFTLPLIGFGLEFRVDVKASIESSSDLCPQGVFDYVFAVGEIWLMTSTTTILLIDRFSTGNIVEILRELYKRLADERSMRELKRQISMGGWCEWMKGYWTRLQEDMSSADDEVIYDSLRPALFVEGGSGRLAVYRYGDVVVLEACPNALNRVSFNVISKETSDELRISINTLISQIVSVVRESSAWESNRPGSQ